MRTLLGVVFGIGVIAAAAAISIWRAPADAVAAERGPAYFEPNVFADDEFVRDISRTILLELTLRGGSGAWEREDHSWVWRGDGRVDLVALEDTLVSQLLATTDARRRDEITEFIRDVRRLRERLNETAVRAEAGGEGRAMADSSVTPLGAAATGRSASGAEAREPAGGADSSTAETRFRALLPFLFGLIYFAIIVAGIYTGSLYENLGAMKSERKIKLRQVLRNAATAGTWQGILASPIVFGVVLVLVPKNEFSLAMAFLAYQNGFFWRATLKKFGELRTAGASGA